MDDGSPNGIMHERRQESSSWRDIPIKNGHVMLVDEGDVPRLSVFKSIVGWRIKNLVYAVGYKCGVRRGVLIHRFLVGASKGSHVHHVNGSGLDNRRSNLKELSPTEHRNEIHTITAANGETITGPICSVAGRAAHIKGSAHKFTSKEAVAAVRRVHELGLSHQFTPEEAREAGRKGGIARALKRKADGDTTPPVPQSLTPTHEEFHKQQGNRAKFIKDLDEIKQGEGTK